MSNPPHWLMFNESREVVGCHCGFVAANEDEGYGDSVVDHLLAAEMIEFRAAVADETSEGRPLTIDDVDDWIVHVHDWPARRFNPLNVPHWITHSLSSDPPVVLDSQTNGSAGDSDRRPLNGGLGTGDQVQASESDRLRTAARAHQTKAPTRSCSKCGDDVPCWLGDPATCSLEAPAERRQ